MPTLKKPATFRIIRFDVTERFLGIAWNYDLGVLITTRDYPTYGEARMALGQYCDHENVELRWFDGEYHVKKGSDQLLPVST